MLVESMNASIQDEEGAAAEAIKQEALSYITGWLLQCLKNTPDLASCMQCDALLVHQEEGDHTYVDHTDHTHSHTTFIKKKKFTSTAGLITPSKMAQTLIRNMEEIIYKGLKNNWEKEKITHIIRAEVERSDVFLDLQEQHPEHAGLIQKLITPKFIMCLLGAELKARNQGASRRKENTHTKKRKMKCFTS